MDCSLNNKCGFRAAEGWKENRTFRDSSHRPSVSLIMCRRRRSCLGQLCVQSIYYPDLSNTLLVRSQIRGRSLGTDRCSYFIVWYTPRIFFIIARVGFSPAVARRLSPFSFSLLLRYVVLAHNVCVVCAFRRVIRRTWYSTSNILSCFEILLKLQNYLVVGRKPRRLCRRRGRSKQNARIGIVSGQILLLL